ncbi:metalloendopeptidase CpaA [Acinetobacter lactucae]|uniref:metalloendopeptidase CpaA n=1 Tax=Acinetobacter lactucae TaxID=1785128 RepID=UPI0021CD9567|nr:metalloendopeptidase CpaA [Acinetobacter lactucae]MCU4347725.1 metalloendopeptidase CpaA [Acinetobacter lactucae]
MNKVKLLTSIIASSMITVAIAATTLSPNQNNKSGVIPSGYDDLIFTISDGNWVKTISLPSTSKEGALLTIKSTAGLSSEIDLSNVKINKKGFLTLKSGNTFSFKFTGDKWELYVAEPENNFNPTKNGNTVPNFSASIAQYSIDDTAWAETVYLPQNPTNDQLLIVKSTATKAAKIDSQNTLFASSFKLNKNDSYIFQYNQKLAKWIPISVPSHIINVQQNDIAAFYQKLQKLNTPKTEVHFANGAWTPSFKLPQTANDRDRIVVTSTADWQSVIENVNTNTTATMKLNKGNRYEFIYISDKSQWVLISSPKTIINAQQAAQGFTFKTPVVEITADNTQWSPSINLPNSTQTGDKVIVSNYADKAFTVTSTNLSRTLNTGDKIRFVFNNNAWNVDSYQIDLLIVNSPVVNDNLGATAAKIRAREALRLTNEALENSQAKAYFREVGYIDHRIDGTSLSEAIRNGRTDSVVQAERTKTGADAIYTITDHSGCGLAWINTTPNKSYMIGSENYKCGITAMRHELGHNMGLGHGESERTTGYHWGFSHPLGSTIMAGNQIGLYSSPNHYSPEYGVRLGDAEKYDGLRKINENAETVSKFLAAVK